MPRSPKPEVVPYTIRIPIELHAQLKALADQHYRLLAREILYALSEYVKKHPPDS